MDERDLHENFEPQCDWVHLFQMCEMHAVLVRATEELLRRYRRIIPGGA